MLSFTLRRLLGLAVTLAARERDRLSRDGSAARRPRRGDAGHASAARHAGGAAGASSASNRPAPERYVAWVSRHAAGRSGHAATPIPPPWPNSSRERVRVSLPLALIALALTTLIAIPARRARGGAAQQRGRLRHHGRDAGRHRRPEFLVRDAAGAALRHHPALAAGGRLSRLVGGRLAGAARADPAGRRAGAAAGLDPGAGDALVAAGDARRRLCAHRTGQGPEPRDRRCAATRCATR